MLVYQKGKGEGGGGAFKGGEIRGVVAPSMPHAPAVLLGPEHLRARLVVMVLRTDNQRKFNITRCRYELEATAVGVAQPPLQQT